jgi:UDP-N-acetylglucosamine 2-epimerase (non-hydrolysing)
MKHLLVVAGTRPEAIKMAPVIEQLQKRSMDFKFVWSGQHYDYEMSRAFFEQLGLPNPDYDLGVRSGTHSEQTAEAMIKLEKIILQQKPSLVVSEGDTNTVVAAAIASVKTLVPFAHVEAGLRSWNMAMPEEINRRIADSVASLHFAPTRLAALNLLFEGTSNRGLHVTGNTIVDIVRKHMVAARKIGDKLRDEMNLEKGKYVLATVHRAENTDNASRLRNILIALRRLTDQFRVVLPIHPRTKRRISQLGIAGLLDGVTPVRPLGYWEFLGLLMNASVVLTDSGGVQEEACTLKVPAVTLRYETERPETLLYGNVLAGTDSRAILDMAYKQAKLAEKIRSTRLPNPFGDGHAGDRIARILKKSIEKNLRIVGPDMRRSPFVTYRLLNARKGICGQKPETLVVFDKSGLPHPSGEVKSPRSKLVRIARSTMCT